MDRRANWNVPNSCSIALALFSGSRVSNAVASARTVALISPLFASTIPLRLIPNPASICVAFSVGLIILERPDFRALAPSEALIPPSRIAVKKNARSSTSPPSC